MNPESRASLIAALIAVDPLGLGGVRLRSSAQASRDQWLKTLRALFPPCAPFRRLPIGISDRQLFGGLDLSATVNSGKPVAEAGLLAAANGGIIIVAMAERLSERTASCLNAAIDSGVVCVPREGVMLEHEAQFGVVALDEGIDEEEAVPASLADRLAFQIDFGEFKLRTELSAQYDLAEVLAAQKRLAQLRLPRSMIDTVCRASEALGVPSCRTALFTSRAARAIAALTGHLRVMEEDLVQAVELVIAHRATALPAAEPPPMAKQPGTTQEPEPPPEGSSAPASDSESDQGGGPLVERVIAASSAAIPADLLERLKAGRMLQPRRVGRSGAAQSSLQRGRPIGTRAGNPTRDGRLNVLATLHAAVPWQRLRTKLRSSARMSIRASDFRVTRYRQRTRTLIVFTIDASGSAALHRLAEAKGAVELILAECYVRRDQVAVIGFRGQSAQILLPPTRSLVRAKLSLAGLPGGGATPLAQGIEAAFEMAVKAQRRGDSPSVVFLTDGRANMGFNGAAGREMGLRDALRAASAVEAAKIPALFIDTSPRPNITAQQIAYSMGARYVPLPSSDSRRILDAVKSQTFGRRGVGT